MRQRLKPTKVSPTPAGPPVFEVISIGSREFALIEITPERAPHLAALEIAELLRRVVRPRSAPR